MFTTRGLERKLESLASDSLRHHKVAIFTKGRSDHAQTSDHARMHNVGRGLFLLLHAGKMLRSVLFASCVTWLLQASLAAQCLPEPVKPCVTHCNGTTFDISNVFQYP